jgi:hypothetical protein
MNLKLFSHLKLKDHLEYGEHLRPIRDWLIILGVSSVLFFASLAWNGFVFYRAVQGEAVGGEATAQIITVDEIKSAQETFIKRSIEEAKYEGEYHFVDPS